MIKSLLFKRASSTSNLISYHKPFKLFSIVNIVNFSCSASGFTPESRSELKLNSLDKIINSFKTRSLKDTFHLIDTHNSGLKSSEYGQVGISLSKMQSSIIKHIENNKLQDAISLWLIIKSCAKWNFIYSSECKDIIVRVPPHESSSVYEFTNFRPFFHQMVTSLMIKPQQTYAALQNQIIGAPSIIAQKFLQEIFLDYTQRLEETQSPVPSPVTFEILVRWLIIQGYFIPASQVIFEMKRLNVVPREVLIQHAVESWSLKLLSVSQELSDICELYVDLSLSPKVEILRSLRDFAMDALKKSNLSSDTLRVLSKLLSAISSGYLRLNHPSIALNLFSLLPLPSQSVLERNYIELLNYYGCNAETSDLEYFESIADILMRVSVVEPTQNPNRAYSVGGERKLRIPKIPKFGQPLTKKLVSSIIVGYSCHQEVESVAQLMQMTLSGGFPSVKLDEDIMVAVINGFARHSNIPAFKFIRKFWRKNLPLSHPWIPELAMIDALSYNRHLDIIPNIIKDLLSSSERSCELLKISVTPSALHLYSFGKKIYQQIASFTPEISAEITEILVTHENGTPPELWAGWSEGISADDNIPGKDKEKLHSMYRFNPSHLKYPVFCED